MSAFDVSNLADTTGSGWLGAIDSLAQTGVNTYNAVTNGANPRVAPATPVATPATTGFFTQKNIMILGGVLLAGLAFWFFTKKK